MDELPARLQDPVRDPGRRPRDRDRARPDRTGPERHDERVVATIYQTRAVRRGRDAAEQLNMADATEHARERRRGHVRAVHGERQHHRVPGSGACTTWPSRASTRPGHDSRRREHGQLDVQPERVPGSDAAAEAAPPQTSGPPSATSPRHRDRRTSNRDGGCTPTIAPALSQPTTTGPRRPSRAAGPARVPLPERRHAIGDDVPFAFRVGPPRRWGSRGARPERRRPAHHRRRASPDPACTRRTGRTGARSRRQTGRPIWTGMIDDSGQIRVIVQVAIAP